MSYLFEEARGPHKIPANLIATLSLKHITLFDYQNATKSSVFYAMNPADWEKDDANGLFVHTSEWRGRWNRAKMIEDGFSPAFVSIVEACLDEGIQWVCFSEHGPVLPTFPTFDW